jgi:hypothetical protein
MLRSGKIVAVIRVVNMEVILKRKIKFKVSTFNILAYKVIDFHCGCICR